MKAVVVNRVIHLFIFSEKGIGWKGRTSGRDVVLCIFSGVVIVWFNVAIVNVQGVGDGGNETVRCFGLLLRCSFLLHRHWLDGDRPVQSNRGHPSAAC